MTDGPRAIAGLVRVVDRLRSADGCAWTAQQTHGSLAGYAVEEAYELADAIARGSREDMIDELGDVLFQVVFHARLGEEAESSFDLDDVARRVAAKLRRRNPHVFGPSGADGATTSDPREIEANWDAVKAAENPERVSPLDGIPAALGPLERAAKVGTRYRRAGQFELLRGTEDSADAESAPGQAGERLWQAVLECVEAGTDPGSALGEHLARVEERLRATETFG